jgi:hypothetical protein
MESKRSLFLGGIELMGDVRSLRSKNIERSNEPILCKPEALFFEKEDGSNDIKCCKYSVISLPQQLSSTGNNRLIVTFDSLVRPSAYIIAFKLKNITGF